MGGSTSPLSSEKNNPFIANYKLSWVITGDVGKDQSKLRPL